MFATGEPDPAVPDDPAAGAFPDGWRNEFCVTLQRLGGDEELFLDLAEMVLEDSAELLTRAEASLAAGRPLEAARELHSLKGLAVNFEVTRLANGLELAESAALAGNGPVAHSRLQDALPALRQLRTRLQEVLRQTRGA